jgi:ribosomal protein S18 acetylase RimI-like enzyme
VSGPSVTIRPFEPADQEAVRRLILAGLVEHWGFLDASKNADLADMQRSYVSEGHTVLVARLGGRLVGTGALVVETESRGRIVRMSVDAAVRRRGIARTLLRRLLEVARERGMREVVVETTHDWHAAIALYRASGFVEYDRHEEDVHLRLAL